MRHTRLFAASVVLLLALPVSAQELPAIAKDTIRVKANMDHGGNVPRWRPQLEARVKGPLPSGAVLWAEFSYAGKKSWVKTDCEANPNIVDEWLAVFCYDREAVSSTFVGALDFTLSMRNELQGSDAVIYKGKAKVFKWVHPKNPSLQEYIVDEDWRLPIGYVYHGDRGLQMLIWFRGRPGGIKSFLFYQGKEIAQGQNCGGFGDDAFDPTLTSWWDINCEFIGIYPTKLPETRAYEPNFAMDQNPGEYEIKLMNAGKLARALKFSVTPDGKLDTSTSTVNNLGSDRAIVPVQIIGPYPWDKTAWKTGAFYGNPLIGFTAPGP